MPGDRSFRWYGDVPNEGEKLVFSSSTIKDCPTNCSHSDTVPTLLSVVCKSTCSIRHRPWGSLQPMCERHEGGYLPSLITLPGRTLCHPVSVTPSLLAAVALAQSHPSSKYGWLYFLTTKCPIHKLTECGGDLSSHICNTHLFLNINNLFLAPSMLGLL